MDFEHLVYILSPGFFLAETAVFLIALNKKRESRIYLNFRHYLKYLATIQVPYRGEIYVMSVLIGVTIAVILLKMFPIFLRDWFFLTWGIFLGALVLLYRDYWRNRLLGAAIYRWVDGTAWKIWDCGKSKDLSTPLFQKPQKNGSLTIVMRFREKGKMRNAVFSVSEEGRINPCFIS